MALGQCYHHQHLVPALYATGPNTERILLALTQLCLSFKIYEWAWYGLWAADKGNSWSVAGGDWGLDAYCTSVRQSAIRTPVTRRLAPGQEYPLDPDTLHHSS